VGGAASQAFRNYDFLRIDHFRGLVSYWEVPAGEKTAVNGKWKNVPVDDFFRLLYKTFPCLPILAEDLGATSSSMGEIMNRYGIRECVPFSSPSASLCPFILRASQYSSKYSWFIRDARSQYRSGVV
jgi:hypothetical protein